MVRRIVCAKCGHDGPWYIVEVTDDYVTIQCPNEECMHQMTLTVGMDDAR